MIGRERGKGPMGKIPGPSPDKSGKSRKNRESPKKDKKGRTSTDRETPLFSGPSINFQLVLSRSGPPSSFFHPIAMTHTGDTKRAILGAHLPVLPPRTPTSGQRWPENRRFEPSAPSINPKLRLGDASVHHPGHDSPNFVTSFGSN